MSISYLWSLFHQYPLFMEQSSEVSISSLEYKPVLIKWFFFNSNHCEELIV